jgi:hypothetical protein
MSVNLEQLEGVGFGNEMTEPPPHPCKPKDASSATAPATPSFSNCLRVGFFIVINLDAAYEAKVESTHLTVLERLYVYRHDETFLTPASPHALTFEVSRMST